MISHIDVVTLYVGDQTAMTAFFTDQCGFEKRTDAQMGPDRGRWIALLAAAAFGREPDKDYPLTFACGDLEAEGQRLRQAGVEVGEIVSEFWGSYRNVTDPEGRVFIIARPTIGR